MNHSLLYIIKQNKWYILPIGLAYIFSVYRLLLFSQIDNHLWFNQYVGNAYVDWFFKYITHVGDGWFLILVALLWSLKNLRQSIMLLVMYAIAGGLTAILKNYVFDAARPHFVFGYYYKHLSIKYVEGVEQLALNSFPSGHSTAAFVLFTFLAFHLKGTTEKLIMSALAILVAFSRVYLSQHWLKDIFAGSLIGLTFTIFIYWIFEKYRLLEKWNKSIIA